MADIIIDFIYRGQILKIACKKSEPMKNIFKRCLIKINKGIKSVCFIYKGYKLNGDAKLEAIINNEKEIQIHVVEVNNIKKEIFYQSKDIICPECGENCFLTIENYKMKLNNCKNGHNLENILFEEYNDTQRINELSIICNECKKISKAKTKNNQFYKCCNCNINLCPGCKLKHNKEHIIIDYESKNYICITHGENYISYCKLCNINLCRKCELKHVKNHKLINYKDVLKRKSFSLYKYSFQKNKSNLYAKFGCKTQSKKKKITINCLDEKQKKKIKNSVENKMKTQIKKISNGSTRKSSDASPVEINTKNNIKKYSLNSRNPQKHLENIKINCISSNKHNNGININFLKKNIEDKNIFISRSKEKDSNVKNKENEIINHPVIPAQFNYFLNNNKGNNTTGKKETFYNSVCSKKIEPLKLFDNEISSSSSSDVNDEPEENESNHKENKIWAEKPETEFMVDSKFKISEGELSEELNESNEDIKIKEHIFKKKLNLNENKNNEEKSNPNKIQKNPDKSCKNMISRFRLAPNQNQISNKKIIVSSILTKAGICDEKEKDNQDSYIIIENLFSQNFNIYGIFDGHGDNGHLISKFISDYMNDYYKNKLNYYLTEEDKDNLFTETITNIFLKNNIQIIKNGQLSLDQEINTNINFDISQSGSTSVIIFLTEDKLICSNIGDSQCFLFNCSSEDLWTFESLSKIHLASDESEQKRIIENGGEIHPYYDENGIFEGPDRIYAKNKIYPGLIMSRTIGDLEAKKIGVISEPDIILKKIENNAKFLVIGSDGLWDVVKPYDVIRLVRPFFNKGDIEGACQILMKKAVQLWQKNREERDDITIIVVFIGTPNNFLTNDKKNFLNKIDEMDVDKEYSSKKLYCVKKDNNNNCKK